VGSGGREHALAWKLADEGHQIDTAPGNPGIASLSECHAVSALDLAGMVLLCRNIQPHLVLIGPEDPLIAGLADELRDNGFVVFGPGRDGARLEGSKAYSKEIMVRAGVPTADSGTFTEATAAIAFASACAVQGRGVVIKASGAALGKGVVVCDDMAQATAAIEAALVYRVFGEAGSTVVVEERLNGREFSLITLCSDGEYWSLPVAQDYKRIFDEDKGPNTGGMGSYSPVPWVDEELVRRTEALVVKPVLEELAERNISYRGVLFSGLMLVDSELYCLEYNVRFGDPETQSIMARLGPGLGEALLACALGEPIPPVPMLENAAVTVVAASAGYPASSHKGDVITVGPMPAGCHCFHAATAHRDGSQVTNGGRVLAITASGDSQTAARTLAYQGLARVRFSGMQFRRDIAACL